MKDTDQVNKVSIVDFKMPFVSLVFLLVKIMLAAIPAIIIFFFIGVALWAIAFGFTSGYFR